jgi:aminoglycoside phosphotransferase (APT) family kinase protein
VQRVVARSSSLAVPDVLLIERDPTLLGGPFCVMECLPGRVAPDYPPYRLSGWVVDSSPTERAAMWRSAVELLAGIHSFDWRAAGLASLRRGSGPIEIDAEIDYYARFLVWANRGEHMALGDRLIEWLRHHLPRAERLQLSWGDARPANMLFSDGRCTGALDWEIVSIGAPEKDLAWWNFSEYVRDSYCGSDTLKGCLKGESLLAAYEHVSGQRLENYAFYEVFTSLRSLAIMTRVIRLKELAGVAADDVDDNAVSRVAEQILRSVPR